MILVLGASGYTGRAVTRALSARGHAVRGFIRDPGKAAAVRGDGAAEVVVADLLDLGAVQRAAADVQGIFFIGPRFMPEEATLGCAVVDIAERLGVRRFVFSGVYHPTIKPLVNHQAKCAIEDRLYRSDLDFTVLQPARFLHNLIIGSWSRIEADGVLADAFSPHVAMAYVDYDDVAEAAAIAFDTERLVRGAFELALPGEHSTHDIAAILTDVLDRPVRAEQVPLLSYTAAAALLSNPFAAAGFAELRDYYDRYGFRGGNSLVLEAVLGRPVADVRTALTKIVERRDGLVH